MPQVARVVAPGVPHHITQRGNRRQKTFFCDDDYSLYRALMAEWCRRHGVEIWAYCLMPNHVHLIAVPKNADSLSCAIGYAHRRYTARVNKRQGWTGHLWQGRFRSYPMDEVYLLQTARYIELNPVRAGMVGRPEDYLWSSANSHFKCSPEILVDDSPLFQLAASGWGRFLELGLDEQSLKEIRLHQATGRPLGGDEFVSRLEVESGRILKPKRRGRKPREQNVNALETQQNEAGQDALFCDLD